MALLIVVATAPQAIAGSVPDADAPAIARKHCVVCHATTPTDKNFAEAPKGVVLETIVELKNYASAIIAQAVQTKAMPLGNRTGMTDDERATLGQWLKGTP